MTLRSLLEHGAVLFTQAADALRATEEVPGLRDRIEALEAQLRSPVPSPAAVYTHKPSTWPKRQPLTQDEIPARGKKEYDTDEVDRNIAIAVLRHNQDHWNEVRTIIAARRRLTLQQVAELKARITRLDLLSKVA